MYMMNNVHDEYQQRHGGYGFKVPQSVGELNRIYTLKTRYEDTAAERKRVSLSAHQIQSTVPKGNNDKQAPCLQSLQLSYI